MITKDRVQHEEVSMSLLISDILQLGIMKDAKVLVGTKLINETAVKWVSAIEMPVENFVRKNEFVLTTAIGCGHDLEEFEKFVQDVIDSKASALAVALGRHIYEIPKEVIEMAEKNNFIIIINSFFTYQKSYHLFELYHDLNDNCL